MKRFLCLCLSTILIIFVLPFQTYAASPSYDKAGYISIRIMPDGSPENYRALLKGNVVYLAISDVATVAGYKNIAGETFARNSGTDTNTLVSYSNGSALAMGFSYSVDHILNNGTDYVQAAQMLYLMHAQWCKDNGALDVYPCGNNIFDFVKQYGDYIYQHATSHEDLLMNGEGNLTNSFRSVISYISNNISYKIFIPWEEIKGDYEDAMMILTQDDGSFLDTSNQQVVNDLINGSPFDQIKTAWDGISDISNLPDNVSDFSSAFKTLCEKNPVTKFNVRNDTSVLESGNLNQYKDKMGAISDVMDIINGLENIADVYTRSKSWGPDFVNELKLLSAISDSEYGSEGKYIKTVAQNLLDEKANSFNAAGKQTAEEVANFAFMKFVDLTPAGKLLDVFSAGTAMLKTFPELATKIDDASLMYTVRKLMNIETVSINQMARNYYAFNLIEVPSNNISSYLMISTSTAQTNSLNNLRNSLMLSLRTMLRDKAFIYHFNNDLNNTPNWVNTQNAKDLKDEINHIYAMIAELMNTKDYDSLLILQPDFSNITSDVYGEMRSDITPDIFHEGDMPPATSSSTSSSNPSPAATSAYTWALQPSITEGNIDALPYSRPLVSSDNASYGDFPGYPSLSLISNNGKYGLIDYSGKIIAEPKYDNISIGYGGKYLLTNIGADNNTYGECFTLDGNLNVISISMDDAVNIAGTDVDDTIAWDKTKQSLCLVNESGITTESVNQKDPVGVSFYNESGTSLLSTAKALAINGKLSTDFIFDRSGEFSDGLIAMSKNGKWGYYDKSGNIVIPFSYDGGWNMAPEFDWSKDDSAYAASSGYVVLYQNKQYALYDTNGKCIIDFGKFDAIRPVVDGKAWVEQNGKWGVISLPVLANSQNSSSISNTSSPSQSPPTNSVSADTSETGLKTLLQQKMPAKMIYFDYEDYEGTGNFEAFAVCSDNDTGYDYENCQLWYADKAGAVMLIDKLNGFPLYGVPDDSVTAGKYKFMVWELSAGGSGSTSLIYGVKDGKPYELSISQKYGEFKLWNGKYQGITGDQAHADASSIFYFSFDESTREFVEIK